MAATESGVDPTDGTDPVDGVDHLAVEAPEPERLRQLAEAAIVPSRTATAPRKVANGRAQDTGWEEF